MRSLGFSMISAWPRKNITYNCIQRVIFMLTIGGFPIENPLSSESQISQYQEVKAGRGGWWKSHLGIAFKINIPLNCRLAPSSNRWCSLTWSKNKYSIINLIYSNAKYMYIYIHRSIFACRIKWMTVKCWKREGYNVNGGELGVSSMSLTVRTHFTNLLDFYITSQLSDTICIINHLSWSLHLHENVRNECVIILPSTAIMPPLPQINVTFRWIQNFELKWWIYFSF